MKTCKNCGAQVPDDKKFCGACGYKFSDENAQTQNGGNQQGQSQNYGYGHQGQSQQGGAQDFASKAGAAFNSGADHTSEFDPQDIAANKVYGIIACFGILFFVPLVAAPQSKYGKFFANQGLLLLITSFAAGIVSSIVGGILGGISSIGSIFFIFGILSGLISFVLWALPFVLFIMLLINAAGGKAKELPVIGKFTIIK